MAADGGTAVAGAGLLAGVAAAGTRVAVAALAGRRVGEACSRGLKFTTVRSVPSTMLSATSPLMTQKIIWLLFLFAFELFKVSPPRLWISRNYTTEREICHCGCQP